MTILGSFAVEGFSGIEKSFMMFQEFLIVVFIEESGSTAFLSSIIKIYIEEWQSSTRRYCLSSYKIIQFHHSLNLT